MAQKVISTLVSDLSGAEESEEVAIETVEFGIDGTEYEMELTADEAIGLRDILEEYKAAARRTAGPTRGRRSNSRPAAPAAAPSRPAGGTTPARRSREETQAIREWAGKHGFEVSARGRIPGDVEEAYEKAHKGRKSGVPAPAPASSIADAPDADTAPAESDGEGTEELSGWQEPTRPLSAVPDVEGTDPADEPETEQPNGRDGLTHSRREAIRAFAKAQGIEVKDKGIIKKELIQTADAWEKAHGSLNVAPAEGPGSGDGLNELRSMLP